MRLCLILAHKYNLITHQCDYSNAYCQSPLDEDLYMEIPPRFCCDVRTKKLFRRKHARKHRNKYVLKLNMSLHGLRQADFNWFSFLTKFLLENGFTQSYVEPCLFCSNEIVILIYVDDTLFIPQSSLNDILSALKRTFQLTDESDIHTFLGISFATTSEGNITLTQTTFIDKVLSRSATSIVWSIALA